MTTTESWYPPLPRGDELELKARAAEGRIANEHLALQLQHEESGYYDFLRDERLRKQGEVVEAWLTPTPGLEEPEFHSQFASVDQRHEVTEGYADHRETPS